MPTILHIDASPRGDHSISRKVSSAFVEAWKHANPGGKVIRRDLTTSNLTFVDIDWIVGAFSAPDQLTEGHKKALALSDTLIQELLEADQVILGTPMYNFNVPAVLKAWIDHIVRIGKTFAYTATGIDGLAKGRKITVAIASGGNYTPGSPFASYNRETEYLQQIFGFIGITDVKFILAGDTNDIAQGKVEEKELIAPYTTEAKKLAAAKELAAV
jgi:FMN-dependent NADH-azoreductase